MTPDATLPPLSSGLAPVDAAWGGFVGGGTYLLVGPAESRGHAALAALRGAADGALGLLVSPRSPEALVAEAAGGGFDLADAYQRGHVKLLRAPAASALAGQGDAGLARALADLADLARHYRPERLVVEDFAAFVRFAAFDAFAEALRGLVEAAAALPTTLVLGLGEPANEGSRRLLDFLRSEVSGTLRLVPQPEGDVLLSLLPGSAHEGDVGTARWAFTPEALPSSEADDETEAAAQEQAEPVESFAVVADATPLPAVPEEEDDPLGDPLGDPFALDAPAPGSSDGFGDADLAFDPPDLIVPREAEGDTDWTPVTPVDPSELPFAGPVSDPFSADPSADLLSLGHFVDSQTAASLFASGDGQAGGLDGAASSIHEAAYPELFAPAPAPAGLPPEDPGTAAPGDDPEAAFRRALAAAFARRSTPAGTVFPDGGPRFLVLALRLDPDGPYADLLPAIADALDTPLGIDGALFGDGAGRLVALLPGAGQEAATELLGAVRVHLVAVAPDRAEEALRAVGALVIPNGQPFASADALLDYVFGE